MRTPSIALAALAVAVATAPDAPFWTDDFRSAGAGDPLTLHGLAIGELQETVGRSDYVTFAGDLDGAAWA
jgi:hypothetical protein